MPDSDMESRRFFVGVIDKLAEARFFLRKLEASTDFLECGYFTSAFGSACYSMIECLKRSARYSTEAKEWWTKTFGTLQASPVHRYFHDGRNADIHEGFGLVAGVQVELIDTGEEVTSRKTPLMSDSAHHSPGSPAQECRDYFESLVRVSLEGYQRFAGTWDPDSMDSAFLGALEREELGQRH